MPRNDGGGGVLAGEGRSQCVAAGDSDLGARIANRNCRESEDALDVGGCVPTRGRRLRLGPFERVAGVGGEHAHPDQELVEAGQAGRARRDRDPGRLATGESDAVRPAGHSVRRNKHHAEEVLEHPAVALDRTARTGAPLLFGVERVHRLLSG